MNWPSRETILKSSALTALARMMVARPMGTSTTIGRRVKKAMKRNDQKQYGHADPQQQTRSLEGRVAETPCLDLRHARKSSSGSI